MTRTIGGTVRTQTRTWTYDPTTQYLTSKTSPERYGIDDIRQLQGGDLRFLTQF